MFKKILLVFILCLPSLALAEQIALKSGEKIEANIIDKSHGYLKIDYKGTALIYYPFEIASIDGKPLDLQQFQLERKPAGKDSAEIIKASVIGPKEYLNRGIALNSKGNFELAISDFNKALEIDKNFAAAYLNRGLAYANKAETEKAISDYNRAIKLDPTKEEAFYLRGLAYSQKKDTDAAIADFTKAVSLNPKYIQPYLNMALLKINKGDFVGAISDMDKVIGINSELVVAYYLRGIGYTNKGNFEQGVADYSKAIILNPKYSEAYVNRGLTYMYKSRQDLIKEDPNSPRRFINIGTTKANKEDLDKALSDCSKAIEISPQYADAYAARARVYIARQEYDKARLDIKKIEELGAKSDPQLLKELEEATVGKNR